MTDHRGTDDFFSPDLLGIFLEQTSDAAFILSPDNVVLRSTRAALRLLELSEPEDAEGRSILSVLTEPVLQLLARRWLEQLDRGEEIREEFPMEGGGGSGAAWYRVDARNISFGGRGFGKYVVISDITEAHTNRKILSALMESLPGEVLIFDRDYRILMASDELARALGFHFWHEALGRSVRDLSGFDFTWLETLVDRSILSGAPIHEVVRSRGGEGGARWYLADLRVIASTAGTFGYMLTRFDVTGQVRPRAILESLMDSASDAISILNSSGNLEYVSRSLAESLGHQSWRSTVNRPWEYLFAYNEHLAAQYAELFDHPLQGQRSGTLSIEGPEGKRFYNYRVDPLSYEGERLGTLAISTDTTELITARNRSESAVRSKAAFLANMSHELRTPMNAVLGMNELLSRTSLSPLQMNYVNQMRSSATLLLSIINDILDFSRIEDRKMELVAAEYSLLDQLRDVTNLMAVKTAEKELSLTADIHPDVPARLVGDALRVKQILINLLNNAVKFTDRGAVSLSVRSEPRDSRSVTLVIAVRDTGIGIPRERQGELFERFSRIDHPGASSVEGTGLGLSICKGLASMMGGSISLESAEGRGSAFTVRIVQGIVHGAAAAARFPPAAGRAVLVFDPDRYVRDSVSIMARHGGLSARVCQNAAEFEDAVGGVDFPWTHVVFEWRSVGKAALSEVSRFPGTRWMALLSLNDFMDAGTAEGIEFVFKPLFIDTFAAFISGSPVDFSRSPRQAAALDGGLSWFRTAGVRALAVDDNTVNLKVIRGFLESFSIAVDEAESGEAAVALAEKNRYDIVFMDHLMPGMDGVETARRIRALPGWAQIPVIALTANTAASSRELYQSAGMNDTLYKPVDFNALVPCLKKWLDPEKIVEIEEQTAAEAAEATAAAEAAPDWPEGLDLAAGIGYTGSRKNLETVLKVFNRTAPRMLEQLEAGRHSGEPGKFRIAVHSLISSCANVGAMALSSHAAALEEAILTGNAEGVDRLFGTVHGELSAAISSVSAWFSARGAS